MDIQIYQLVEGARNAQGIAVIIDVFRAFTTACYFFRNGAEAVLPIDDVNLAYQLKKEHPEYILAGERNEVMLPGFDYGNSPANIEHVDFTGKTIVHTTSAGTQGIAGAVLADEILTGSLANAPAIARYIEQKAPKQVSLVCMGKAAKEPVEEDTCCAQYLRSLLLGEPFPLEREIQKLRQGEGRRFFIPGNQAQCPERDFTLSTTVGTFDFVLKAERLPEERTIYRLRRIPVA